MFLLGPMRKHIEGHKNLTDNGQVKEIKAPAVVAIPLTAMNSVDIEVYVNPGDRVLVGQKVAARNDHFYIPIFSSVSGTVKEIADEFATWSPRKIKHLFIENDEQYEPAEATPCDYQAASKDEIVQHIKQMGIVGCGGAGFPTYLKYQPMKETEVLIINAVECEPYLTVDYTNLTLNIEDLGLGVRILAKAANAKKVQVAIKEDKKAAIELLEKEFANDANISVAKVPNVYPMGWERTLVFELLNKRYEKLPSEVGAIVNNATTAIAVAQAFRDGIKITEKLFTVSGDGIKNPTNCRAKIGTPFADIIEACGGTTCENVHVIAGGPMMGKTMLNANVRVNFTTNSMTILQERVADTIACLRCGACVDHCPAGLIPVQIAQAETSKNLDLIARLDAMSCIECGLCTFVCPSKIDVTENVRRAKNALRLRK